MSYWIPLNPGGSFQKWYGTPSAFLGGASGKEPACKCRRCKWLGFNPWEDPLEEDMATYSNTHVWRILWTEEPGRYSTQGGRVGCNWSDWALDRQTVEHLTLQNYPSQARWRELKYAQPRKTSSHNMLAAAKSLQSCPTLCDPIDGSPPGCPVPGILQARTLEWVAISFSNAWKWKVKVKSFSRVWLFATPWAAAYQAPASMGFSRQEYWSGLPLPSPNNMPKNA